MTDDKGDNIPEPVDEAVSTAQTEAQQSVPPDGAPIAPTGDNKLGGLMADAPKAAPNKPSVDLEAEAMRAAESALAEGEKALAAARVELKQEATAPQPAAKPTASKTRELVLRVLLAVNILAMVVVSLLPSPADTTVEPVVEQPKPVEPAPQPEPRQMSEPVNRALLASENGDWVTAISVLESYLDQNPRMHAAERLSVMTALSIYAARNQDYAKSEKYWQQAQALEQTHYLPEDLVKMAEAAIARGDQETLRRVWARFLLQQRQIPTWLYQHVAQAYLELGDSYRKDADSAAEAVRLKELNEASARLRAEALKQQGGK